MVLLCVYPGDLRQSFGRCTRSAGYYSVITWAECGVAGGVCASAQVHYRQLGRPGGAPTELHTPQALLLAAGRPCPSDPGGGELVSPEHEQLVLEIVRLSLTAVILALIALILS